MNNLKRILALILTVMLMLTSFAALAVYAEESDSSEVSSSEVESSEDESESSVEESSEEEKSSSSSSSSSPSSSEESSEEIKSFSSSEEDAYAQTIVDEETGFAIGLSQPNKKLLMSVRAITAQDTDCAEAYNKLLGASKDKELICAYEVELGGDDEFDSKVTVMVPVDANIIGRDMVVLFYAEDATRVDTSNKSVTKALQQSTSGKKKSSSADDKGVIKVSETLESGKKYYFAVCEFADFVPTSRGIGVLEIFTIIVGIMALASGGLLAFLWIRYNKKQEKSGKPEAENK